MKGYPAFTAFLNNPMRSATRTESVRWDYFPETRKFIDFNLVEANQIELRIFEFMDEPVIGEDFYAREIGDKTFINCGALDALIFNEPGTPVPIYARRRTP